MDLCPICGSSCSLFRESRRCTSCGTVRTNFQYNPDIYGSKYAKIYLKYQQAPTNNPLNLVRLGLVSRWLHPGNLLLDVGCCIGEFIRFAEKYYACVGFEPNDIAARWARSRVESFIYDKLNGEIPRANMVTMFDVLEHLEEPVEFLKLLAENYLTEKGVIVITTPDVGVIPISDMDRLHNWKHYKPMEHLFLYTWRSLSIMLKKSGFHIIHYGQEESDVRPGNPDGDILTIVARKTQEDES